MFRYIRVTALFGALMVAAPLAAQPLVYVTDPAANTVTVINSGTNTIERTLAGVQQARAAAISPDGTRVYVAASSTSGDGIVVVIDATKISDQNVDPVIATLKTGGNPIALSYDARTDLLYLACALNRKVIAYQLDTIDPDHPQAVATYPGGNSLDAMALSPDGNYIALASAQDKSITLYNRAAIAAGLSGKSLLALGSAPQAVRFSALGNKLWIATANGIALYDLTVGSVTSTTIAGGTNSIAIAPRTGTIYFGTDAGDIYAYVPGSPIMATLATKGPIAGLALSADGTRLYAVQNCSICGLSILDPATGQLLRQIQFGAAPATVGDFAGPGDIHARNLTVNGHVDTQLSSSVEAEDYSSRALSYALIQPPANGQLNFNSTGDFTYTPPTGYSGIQAFVWQAGASSGEGSPNAPRSRPVTQTLYILPSISSIGDQKASAGGKLGPLAFTIDGTKPLQINVTSSNGDLVDASQVSVSAGCGSSSLSCSLTIPIKNVDNGNSQITLAVIDSNGLGESTAFKVTVGNGKNDDGGGAVDPFSLGALMLLVGLILVRRRKHYKAHERL